jgi:hypothetical protein
MGPGNGQSHLRTGNTNEIARVSAWEGGQRWVGRAVCVSRALLQPAIYRSVRNGQCHLFFSLHCSLIMARGSGLLYASSDVSAPPYLHTSISLPALEPTGGQAAR